MCYTLPKRLSTAFAVDIMHGCGLMSLQLQQKKTWATGADPGFHKGGCLIHGFMIV